MSEQEWTYDRFRVWPMLRVRVRELRQPLTRAEAHLWQRLRDRQLAGLKFRRQHVIDRYVADFYCAEAHLVIELDGSIHAQRTDLDAFRTAWLQRRGFHVLRFPNEAVLLHTDDVLQTILAACQAHRPPSP